MKLTEYVAYHTTSARRDSTEPYADMVFMQVAMRDDTDAETFRRITRTHKGEFCDLDPLDGQEHNYLALGGWVGDQGIALRYMALGHLVGVFQLLTPRTMLGDLIPEDLVSQLAGMGMVAIQAR